MAATDQLYFFSGAKIQKISLVNFFKNINITFLAACGCASDFKDATRIQNGRQKSTPKFFVGTKYIQILQSYFPHYGDVQVIF